MCPLTGDDCLKHGCDWYMHVLGKDPQTGAEMDKWGCSMSFIPMLLIENSREQRSTSKSIQSFRNEVVKGNDHLRSAIEAESRKISNDR